MHTSSAGKQPDFLGGKIGPLLMSLAIPAIFAQLVNALYNIVDRIYIGRIPDVGEAALGGIGVSFPIIILISATTALFGMGGAPLVSIKMGEKDQAGAERILGNCFAALLGAGVLLMVVFMVVKRPVLWAFGARDPEILQYAMEYLGIYLWGTVFVMISLGMNSFINAQGFARIGMATVGIGAVCNIILDPIFIFGFGMGVKGAATATVISQLCSAIWALRFLFGPKTVLKIRRENLRPEWKLLMKVMALGFAPFVMQSTESLIQVVFNNSLDIYGGKMYVSSMTILTACMQMASMPLQGLTQGAQPIIGYNYGAGRYDRVRTAVRWSLGCCLTLSISTCLLCTLGSHWVAAIFAEPGPLRDLAAYEMRIFMAGVGIFGVQTACQNAFLALGKAKVAICMALLRKVVILIPLVLILPRFAGLGVQGVYIAEPVADILAATTTGILFSFTYRKLGRMEKGLEEGPV
ncbi:MAG: MATE family efflux transporter [Eubacteriales bacterium]|jgi:putative MATE family efflux protein